MHLFTHFASPKTVLGFSSDPAPAKSQHSDGGSNMSKTKTIFRKTFFNTQILAQHWLELEVCSFPSARAQLF